MAKASKKKKTKAKKTMAFHGKDHDGLDVVGIGNLHVVIIKDDDAWFAQGLEIDYAVQGSSIANAKKRFERGLCATVHQNLKAFGNIEGILKPAPPEVWKDLAYRQDRKLKEYSCVSWHDIQKDLKLEEDIPQFDLPFFSGIKFVESRPAA